MLKKDTLAFLSELRENNNRDWFTANKKRFEQAKADAIALTGTVQKLIRSFDDFISKADPKSCMMRIYRDVRFSTDKLPYKKNFGIVFCKGARLDPGTCYYLHIEPGDRSFLAGGYWMPEAEHLRAIRQEIDYNADKLMHILESPGFKKHLKKLDESDKLKTAPKGFEKDHPQIELLKLKSFTVSSPLKDSQLQDPKILDHMDEVYREILPLNRFIREAIQE